MVLQLIGKTPLSLMTVVRCAHATKDRMKRNHLSAEMTHAGKSEDQ
jgi:hypothetical protein